jgi:hypothetical protein
MSRLSRRYRRLLCCYPRAYRRTRGDELVATLLEAAPPGRTRPTAREAADLLRHGLRARLGRPASRSVVAWALLAAVIGGLFGAAFASRAGWETARPLPGPPQTRELLLEILPGTQWGYIDPAPPAVFVIYNEPLGWSTASELLVDGGEYQAATVGANVFGGPGTRPQETLAEALANLRVHGWTVSRPVVSNMHECAGPPCDPATIPTSTTITARRGDTVLTLIVNGESDPGTTFLSATFQRAAPPAVWPSAIAGGLLAAAAAFLLFGWASRRADGHFADAAVRFLFGVTLVAWWVPTLVSVTLTAGHHAGEPHPAWHPLWEWLGQPALLVTFLLGAASALLALGVCALPRGGTVPAAGPTKGRARPGR